MHDLHLIGDVEGFTPHIGRLVSMLNYVRHTTLDAVAGLEPSQLDYMHDAQSNSIGALLSHIAAAEVGYQAATFHDRELSPQEKDEWGAAFALGDRAKPVLGNHDLHLLSVSAGIRKSKKGDTIDDILAAAARGHLEFARNPRSDAGGT